MKQNFANVWKMYSKKSEKTKLQIQHQQINDEWMKIFNAIHTQKVKVPTEVQQKI